MRFVVSTDGLDEALGTLRLLATKGEDLAPMLDELGRDEEARVLMRFEHGEAPDGTTWQGQKNAQPTSPQDNNAFPAITRCGIGAYCKAPSPHKHTATSCKSALRPTTPTITSSAHSTSRRARFWASRTTCSPASRN